MFSQAVLQFELNVPVVALVVRPSIAANDSNKLEFTVEATRGDQGAYAVDVNLSLVVRRKKKEKEKRMSDQDFARARTCV